MPALRGASTAAQTLRLRPVVGTLSADIGFGAVIAMSLSKRNPFREMTMRMYWLVSSCALAAIALTTSCGADHVEGCTSDAHCRGTRVCFLDTNSCEEPTGPTTPTTPTTPVQDPNQISIDDVADPPDEVIGAPQFEVDDFEGSWLLRANGNIRSDGGNGTIYDEQWHVMISAGDSHDLTLTFESTSAPGIERCVARGTLAGAGFVFVGGPCRDGGYEVEEFTGAGYFDRFDELTVHVSGDADQLATQYVFAFDFVASGVQGQPGPTTTLP